MSADLPGATATVTEAGPAGPEPVATLALSADRRGGRRARPALAL